MATSTTSGASKPDPTTRTVTPPPADGDAVAQRVAQLRAENEKLRAQLAAAGRAGVNTPQFVFQLSEGERQELEIYGVVNKNGRAMTKDDVEAEMAKAGQEGVEIADAPEETKINPGVDAVDRGTGIRGIDYVYPSIEAGKIDPAVAGTPGISGPSADSKAAE